MVTGACREHPGPAGGGALKWAGDRGGGSGRCPSWLGATPFSMRMTFRPSNGASIALRSRPFGFDCMGQQIPIYIVIETFVFTLLILNLVQLLF